MVRDHPVGLFAMVMVSIGKPITSFTSFPAVPARPLRVSTAAGEIRRKPRAPQGLRSREGIA
ncbi:hypothetical protein DK412_24405 [Methylobacterium sp. 17Sr1-1]|nr:hypothetical protein DK412_24405 [Methylobacterium sp. 17Sr1-1]